MKKNIGIIAYVLLASASIGYYGNTGLPEMIWYFMGASGAILVLDKFRYIKEKNIQIIYTVTDICLILICNYLSWKLPNDMGILKNTIISLIVIAYFTIWFYKLGWYKRIQNNK